MSEVRVSSPSLRALFRRSVASLRLADGKIEVRMSWSVAYTSYSLVPSVRVIRLSRKSWGSLGKLAFRSGLGTKYTWVGALARLTESPRWVTSEKSFTINRVGLVVTSENRMVLPMESFSSGDTELDSSLAKKLWLLPWPDRVYRADTLRDGWPSTNSFRAMPGAKPRSCGSPVTDSRSRPWSAPSNSPVKPWPEVALNCTLPITACGWIGFS